MLHALMRGRLMLLPLHPMYKRGRVCVCAGHRMVGSGLAITEVLLQLMRHIYSMLTAAENFKHTIRATRQDNKASSFVLNSKARLWPNLLCCLAIDLACVRYMLLTFEGCYTMQRWQILRTCQYALFEARAVVMGLESATSGLGQLTSATASTSGRGEGPDASYQAWRSYKAVTKPIATSPSYFLRLNTLRPAPGAVKEVCKQQ